jgi:DNA (cytosine-5)-methyltransferase 1
MEELGYGVSWRVLDAVYWGVPQFRRRVFVVGHLGDWASAGKVLQEPESMCRSSETRTKKRKDIAGTLSSRTSGGGGLGTDFELKGGLIATSTGSIAHCLNAGGMGRIDYETETMVVVANRVRQILPVEAERLQGLPDNWTLVPHGPNGKMAADGPRYKACGNSMAVPVMRWIGERISAVDM